MTPSIKIGSRASELALYQAELVKSLLKAHAPTLSVEIIPISTEGDERQEQSIADLGGKGVFVKGLEAKLLSKEIDFAVHSFKDLTSKQPDDLCLAGFLPPESQADVLVFQKGMTVEKLEKGGLIGTGSLRRKRILKTLFPKCECVPIRGNIRTRLSYLEKDLDAVMLSEVSLTRLGIRSFSTYRLNPLDHLPAPGQGALAIQCRRSDSALMSMIQTICDADESLIRSAEYEVMSGIGFDCSLPLGMLTLLKDNRLSMAIQLGGQQVSTGDSSAVRSFYLQEQIPLESEGYQPAILKIVTALKQLVSNDYERGS